MIQISFANKEAEVLLAYAKSLGYVESTVVPGTPETLTYNEKGEPVNVPAVPDKIVLNKQTAEEYIQATLTENILAPYKANLLKEKLTLAETEYADKIKTAKAEVEATISALNV